MKRFLVLATLVAVAAVPGTTTASTSTGSGDAAYAARGGQDLKIRFKIRTVNGKPTQIRRYRFKNLTASCAGGGPANLEGQIGLMKINDNKRFDGVTKTKSKKGKVVVNGVVKKGGKKVKGTIRGKGKFGQARGCDSGKVRWVAMPN